MPSMKSLAITAAVVIGVLALANRVPALAKITGKAA